MSKIERIRKHYMSLLIPKDTSITADQHCHYWYCRSEAIRNKRNEKTLRVMEYFIKKEQKLQLENMSEKERKISKDGTGTYVRCLICRGTVKGHYGKLRTEKDFWCECPPEKTNRKSLYPYTNCWTEHFGNESDHELTNQIKERDEVIKFLFQIVTKESLVSPGLFKRVTDIMTESLKNDDTSTAGTAKQRMLALEIFIERERQKQKWGKQEHNLVEWMAILTEEVGEAAQEAVDYHFTYKDRLDETNENLISRFRTELVQVMAVAMQMVEDIDERYVR